MEESPKQVPWLPILFVGFLTALVITGVVWALTLQTDGIINPIDTTTTTVYTPEEFSSGLEQLAQSPFQMSYTREDASGEITVTASVDPVSQSASFVTGDQTIIVKDGAQFEQVTPQMKGSLPANVTWIKRTQPVETLDLTALFPVDIPTPQGDQNLLTYQQLPGELVSNQDGQASYRLILTGVTDTSPPAATVAWQLNANGVLGQMESLVKTQDGSDVHTVLVVSDVGTPQEVNAPPAENTMDEASLPAPVAALLE